MPILLAVQLAVAQSPEERTRQALEMVLAGKCEAFYAQFSLEMKQAITLQTYAAQVSQIMTALGQPQSQDPPKTRHIGGAVTVTIPVHWAVATPELRRELERRGADSGDMVSFAGAESSAV